MEWTREEYLDHMTFKAGKREMFCELFGPLIGLNEEWEKQGAAEKERTLEAFGWDYVKYAYVPFNILPMSGIETKVISSTSDETISIDAYGRTMRLCRSTATIPLPQDYPVNGPDDWERIRHWYRYDESRLDMKRIKELKHFREEGGLIVAAMPGGFDEIRQLMGEEGLCYAYYDEPDMISDMLKSIADMCIRSFERILDVVTVDCLTVHEDMASKSGPMIGENLVRKFIAPYYRAVWQPLHDEGARLFSQDSDGNMEPLIDAFIDTGLNCMYPAEPHAGMDIRALRKKYGSKMAFKGGIDKFALRGTKEDIRRELEYKLTGECLGGGTVFGIDHRIPNGVPIDNYRYYVKLGRDMLGLGPAKECRHVRMAF